MKSSSAIAAFISDCRLRRLSPHTVRSYEWALAFLPERLPTGVRRADRDLIRELLANPKLSPASARDVYRVFCVFFKWASLELGASNPMVHIRPPRAATWRPRVFRTDELRRLANACETTQETALFTVLLETGVRIAEAASMRWDRITQVRDRDDKYAPGVMVVDGKTGPRDVPLSQAVMSALVGVGGPIWIWIGRRGPLTPSGLAQVFDRLRRRAGIDGARASVHTFRHTFVTEQLRLGRPLPMVQRMAGHTSINTTMAYVHLLTEDVMRGHEEFSVVKRYGLGG